MVLVSAEAVMLSKAVFVPTHACTIVDVCMHFFERAMILLTEFLLGPLLGDPVTNKIQIFEF